MLPLMLTSPPPSQSQMVSLPVTLNTSLPLVLLMVQPLRQRWTSAVTSMAAVGSAFSAR